MKHLDLVCFGNPYVDVLHANGRARKLPGGPEHNTAIAFAQLGGKVGLIGRFGSDQERFLLPNLKEKGVDISRLRIDDKPTFTIDVYSTAKERTFKERNSNHSLGDLTSADERYISNARAVFTSIRRRHFQSYVMTAAKVDKPIYLSGHSYKGPPRQH